MFDKPLTGKHVALIFGGAFAVIISVNLTLAFNAVRTFPGLETKNSYVVSQAFERERKAQLALGWDVALDYDAGALRLSIRDEAGPVFPKITQATLGRATHVNQDITPEFAAQYNAYEAEIGTLEPGNWNLRLVAEAEDGTRFRRRIVLRVPK
jgi:nitrogen fixation protein FixH